MSSRLPTPDFQPARVTLAGAPLGEPLRILSVDIDDASAAWLSAVGLAPGEEVVVLRRAAAGGPLHLRLEAGGELAIARDLAAEIGVARRQAST